MGEGCAIWPMLTFVLDGSTGQVMAKKDPTAGGHCLVRGSNALLVTVVQ